MNRKNMRLINEFLKERRKLQTAREADIIRLKEMYKNKYIDGDNYQRLKNVMIMTHEKKRIELVDLVARKIAKKEALGTSLENLQIEKDAETGSSVEQVNVEDVSEIPFTDRPNLDSEKQ